MYADKLEQEGAAALYDEPEPPSNPDERLSSPTRDRMQRRTPPIDIMLLGPSGSGKSSLFNMVTNERPQAVSGATGLCTTYLRTSRIFTIGGRAFRLIDSPGFHTTSLNDSEILKKIVIYLLKPRDSRRPAPLSGILYLHPEGDGVGDDRLKGTMESLKHLVGEPWLPSVTIAVLGSSDPDRIAQLRGLKSPFYSLYSGGAKILPLSLEIPKVEEILLGFSPEAPPPCSILSKGPHRIEPGGKTERPRRITLEESEISRQQLQATLDEIEIELKSLRSQLEQTQLEYASLRSELQLNDNTEQSKIVQSLQDLNRAIDDFGRFVAEYMVDHYKGDRFNNENPTTLDASDFTELQRQFGHQGGKPSLAASYKGDGLPIEDFIDLALRSFLCQKLCKDMFIPFHPSLVACAEPDFMASLYEGVRCQVSPTVAAKWRASSFVALSKGNKLEKPIMEEQVESLVAGDIQQLFNNLFGRDNEVTLTESQRRQLQDVVAMAWELNYMLKGEVVTLGDFQPLCYARGVPFDPKTMVEFEPDRKRKPGNVAICTVRLGLSLSYSKGAGKDASPVIVYPATVVTQTVYDS
ncbi:hypothetical protein OPQ81_011676 [Rhizoctonia solani]|nr:hypothetical protein OPQ81_011676 [Rhizoctonia solani]